MPVNQSLGPATVSIEFLVICIPFSVGLSSWAVTVSAAVR